MPVPFACYTEKNNFWLIQGILEYNCNVTQASMTPFYCFCFAASPKHWRASRSCYPRHIPICPVTELPGWQIWRWAIHLSWAVPFNAWQTVQNMEDMVPTEQKNLGTTHFENAPGEKSTCRFYSVFHETTPVCHINYVSTSNTPF